MSDLARVLRKHMQLTCEDLGLEVIRAEFAHCHWITDQFNVRSAFEIMRKTDPAPPPGTYFLIDQARAASASSMLEFFGYEAEAEWVRARVKICAERVEDSETELKIFMDAKTGRRSSKSMSFRFVKKS